MKYAIVQFRKEGFHKYPEAPEGVEFLSNLHRHEFHIKVRIQVHHNDRDIEYILFKRECELLWDNVIEATQERRSCEDIAEAYIGFINERYPNRQLTVWVFEDGENGAEVTL